MQSTATQMPEFKRHTTPTHLGGASLDSRIARLLGSGKRIVDLGCGSGYALDFLAGRYEEAIGLDISSYRYEHRTDSKHQWRFIPADLDDEFPVESESADAVLANQIIEHVQNPLRFTMESFRILKPGGVWACATPNVAYIRHMARLVLGHWPMTADGSRTLESWDEGHIRLCNPE